MSRLLRKAVCYCPKCNMVSSIIEVDTIHELEESVGTLQKWHRCGNEIRILTHVQEDPEVAWCSCMFNSLYVDA